MFSKFKCRSLSITALSGGSAASGAPVLSAEKRGSQVARIDHGAGGGGGGGGGGMGGGEGRGGAGGGGVGARGAAPRDAPDAIRMPTSCQQAVDRLSPLTINTSRRQQSRQT